MARYLFGGASGDIVVQTNATSDTVVHYQPGVTITVWNSPTGGTQLTDLQLEYGGTPVSTLMTSATGRLPRFFGPDGVTEVWLNTGDSDRYVLESTDLGDLVNNKLGKTETPVSHTHAASDVPALQRQLDAAPRVVMFNTTTNTWPVQADITPTYPAVPVLWRGQASVPAQARWGIDYIDTLGDDSTNIPDPDPTPDPAITLSTPTASVNGANVTLAATLTSTAAQTFAHVQIAVRGPSGQAPDVGMNDNVSVAAGGVLNIAAANGGSFTATASGTWTAYASYNITGGTGQSSWVDGPHRTFTVTVPSGGNPVPGGVPLVGKSGKAWNSGAARWTSGENGSVALANAFGTWRGRPVDGFLHFAIRDTWDNMFLLPSEWPGYDGYIVNSLPPQPDGQNNQATAAGTNNARWEDYGRALTAAGLNRNTYVIRVWEVNGNWYSWSWGNENGSQGSANTPESFVAALKNMSTSVKKYAPNVKISVNLNRGSKRSGTTWQSVFDQMLGSGSSGRYFDIIGCDTYDWYPGQTDAASWASAQGQQPSMADIASYCRSHGLQMGIEEWALIDADGGSEGGAGGDNPYYITSMYSAFTSYADILAYEGYYEDNGAPDTLLHRMMTGHYPSADAAYRNSSRWGT